MPLQGFTSLCKERQGKIVSKDKGNQRKHIAHNIKPSIVSYYQIDGIVITEGKRCDFLLMNENTQTAYLIELKGRDLNKAVEQLEATEYALRTQLKGYDLQFRIVCSNSRTHKTPHSSYSKYRMKKGKAFRCETDVLEENI